MLRTSCWFGVVCFGLLLGKPLHADNADEPIKDRKNFIPQRNHLPLEGKVIGLLVYDGQPVLSTEGRSGPPDQLCFAVRGASYRWVYVPTLDNPMITNLQVPVGPKGDIQIFPSLNMASPRSVTPWGITKPYTLVEVTVNNGQGSPAGDSFVATHMKSVEGTKEYPLKVTDAIDMLKKRYAGDLKKMDNDIESAMTLAGKKALKDKMGTGPREKNDLMFLTWLPNKERLRAHFRTKISDGAYTFIEGGGARPFDLPPPPREDQEAQPQGRVKAPPPPPRFKVKTGVTFGVELGMAYEVDKDGKLVGSQSLAIESFQEVLALPPIGGPRPLPPRGEEKR